LQKQKYSLQFGKRLQFPIAAHKKQEFLHQIKKHLY